MGFSIQLIDYLYSLIQTIDLIEQTLKLIHNCHAVLNDIYLVCLKIHLIHQLNFVPCQQLTNYYRLDNSQLKRLENRIQIVVILGLRECPNSVQYYPNHLSIHANYPVSNQYNLHHLYGHKIAFKENFKASEKNKFVSFNLLTEQSIDFVYPKQLHFHRNNN